MPVSKHNFKTVEIGGNVIPFLEPQELPVDAYYDPDTKQFYGVDGKQIDVNTRSRMAKNWGRPFIMAFQDGFKWLSEQDIKGTEWKILIRLMSQLDFDNYWKVSQKQLGEELGIAKQNVHAALKKFVNMGILFKGPLMGRSNSYRLNPFVGHKGSLDYEKTLIDFKTHLDMKKKSETSEK